MTTGTNQEVYTNDDHEANEATLVARWERILQDEGLSSLEEDGLLVDGDTLYLGVAGTTGDGIDLPGETDVKLFDGEAEEEISTPVGTSSPVLLPEDFEVLANLHASREAMTLDEAEASPESIVRLAAAGFAHGRIPEEGDVVVLATAGATDRDVWRAVNRARCDAIEASFLADIVTCEEIAEGVRGRVGRLGGACDERELVESFAADHPREAMEATLAEPARRGAVRRTANRKSGVRLVADPEAGGEALVGAAKNIISLRSRSVANRKISGKVFATEASGSRPEDDVAQVPLVAGMEAALAEFLRARNGGSLAVSESKAEAGRIERNRARMRAEFIERRTSGRPLVVTEAKVLDERHDRRRSRQARKRNFWARISAKALTKANAEKIALDTARAVLRNLGIDPEALTDDERRRAVLTVLASDNSGIRTSGRLAATISGFKAASANASAVKLTQEAQAQASVTQMSSAVAA